MSFSGDAPSRDSTALSFRRILWRSEKLNVALVELEGAAPEPLSIERSTPSLDLSGRKAFVAGYPYVGDSRIPAVLSEVFSAASGRVAKARSRHSVAACRHPCTGAC